MMRTLLHVFVACALIGTGLPASAAADEPAPPDWEGVWRGTIGTQPVYACLYAQDGAATGVYYYEKHLATIRLTTPEQGGTAALALSEDPGRGAKQAPPLWTLAFPADRQMSGTWTGAGKPLPIHLKQIVPQEVDNDDGPCASADFNAPREGPARVKTSAASLGGTGYRVLTLDFGGRINAHVSSIELAGTGNARVNALLRGDLTYQQSDAYLCSRSSLAQYGAPGQYDDRIAPVTISSQWLVTEHTNYISCGAVHPNDSITHETWNLVSAKQVDVWDWFAPAGASKVRHGDEVALTIGARLSTLLAQAWADSVQDDCKDATSGAWAPYPTADGIAFTPALAHVVYACTTDVVIPYAKIAPLLNAQGKAALATFRRAAQEK